MKLSVSKKTADMKDGGNNGYINGSAIYDVTINYVQVADTKNGAKQLNFNVTNGTTEQTIFGPILFGVDGKVNEITQSLLNRLCIIVGMEDGQEIETETAEYKVGKEQTLTEMEVIPHLAGAEVKMRIQMEYSTWNNNIQERKAIKAFYRADGATAAEAESGENIGKRLAIEEEKYASNVTYKDGLTPEDVAAWIKTKISGKTASASANSPVPKASAKRPLFGKAT